MTSHPQRTHTLFYWCINCKKLSLIYWFPLFIDQPSYIVGIAFITGIQRTTWSPDLRNDKSAALTADMPDAKTTLPAPPSSWQIAASAASHVELPKRMYVRPPWSIGQILINLTIRLPDTRLHIELNTTVVSKRTNPSAGDIKPSPISWPN